MIKQNPSGKSATEFLADARLEATGLLNSSAHLKAATTKPNNQGAYDPSDLYYKGVLNGRNRRIADIESAVRSFGEVDNIVPDYLRTRNYPESIFEGGSISQFGSFVETMIADLARYCVDYYSGGIPEEVAFVLNVLQQQVVTLNEQLGGLIVKTDHLVRVIDVKGIRLVPLYISEDPALNSSLRVFCRLPEEEHESYVDFPISEAELRFIRESMQFLRNVPTDLNTVLTERIAKELEERQNVLEDKTGQQARMRAMREQINELLLGEEGINGAGAMDLLVTTNEFRWRIGNDKEYDALKRSRTALAERIQREISIEPQYIMTIEDDELVILLDLLNEPNDAQLLAALIATAPIDRIVQFTKRGLGAEFPFSIVPGLMLIRSGEYKAIETEKLPQVYTALEQVVLEQLPLITQQEEARNAMLYFLAIEIARYRAFTPEVLDSLLGQLSSNIQFRIQHENQLVSLVYFIEELLGGNDLPRARLLSEEAARNLDKSLATDRYYPINQRISTIKSSLTKLV